MFRGLTLFIRFILSLIYIGLSGAAFGLILSSSLRGLLIGFALGATLALIWSCLAFPSWLKQLKARPLQGFRWDVRVYVAPHPKPFVEVGGSILSRAPAIIFSQGWIEGYGSSAIESRIEERRRESQSSLQSALQLWVRVIARQLDVVHPLEEAGPPWRKIWTWMKWAWFRGLQSVALPEESRLKEGV